MRRINHLRALTPAATGMQDITAIVLNIIKENRVEGSMVFSIVTEAL